MLVDHIEHWLSTPRALIIDRFGFHKAPLGRNSKRELKVLRDGGLQHSKLFSIDSGIWHPCAVNVWDKI